MVGSSSTLTSLLSHFMLNDTYIHSSLRPLKSCPSPQKREGRKSDMLWDVIDSGLRDDGASYSCKIMC